METVMRTKRENEFIENQIEQDTQYANWVDYRSSHFGNYREEFGDIYTYMNKKHPQFSDTPNELMKTFLESKKEDMEKIKTGTVGKSMQSYMASKRMMYMYEDVLEKTLEDCKKKDSDFNNKSEEEKLQSLNELVQKQPLKVKIRVNQKMEEVKEEIENDLNVLQTIGYGGGNGSAEGIDKERVLQFLNLMKKDDMIRKIIQQAGKFINTAKHKIMTRCKGSEDVIGVELGDNLNRFLPTEIAMLALPEFEFLQSLKYIQKEVPQYEKESEESKTLGDIVVVIDESGSMSRDDNIVKAKAMLFGIMEQAKHDKRKVDVIGFGGANEGYTIKDLTMEKLLELVENFKSYGDTNFEVPLNKAIEMVGSHSDIIFITDGYAPISDSLKESVKSAMENLKVKIITMQFGRFCNADLESISSSFNTTWSLFVDKALA
jgi:uncharacterized protein with von Willebrand factor type A (vWA) domain